MPVQLSYPGVYVEEWPSGQHGITPVATSIAAFVGRAPIGPVDLPVTVFSYGDFMRTYGGLTVDYPLTYAVRDFFDNGGSQAVIARLFEPAGPGDGVARLTFPGADAPLSLVAANPGVWGNRLTATIDARGLTPATAVQYEIYGLAAADLFNLTLELTDARGRVVASERYVNLSVKAGGAAVNYPNRIDRVLRSQSVLARVDRLPAAAPDIGATAAGSGGDDGGYLSVATWLGDECAKTGIHLLGRVDLFNLLCIPPDGRILDNVPAEAQQLDPAVVAAAARMCVDRRAFFIVDPPVAWRDMVVRDRLAQIDPAQTGLDGTGDGADAARNAAVFFPRMWQQDILAASQPALFAPCGAIAGVIAATDAARGVWHAPAGMDAGLARVTGFEIDLNDDTNGVLNPLGINCLRTFPTIGPVIWGSRTLRGADGFADDFKYIPVRRLTLFIEESVRRGIAWAVFEPNNEALWSSLRLSVDSFLADLARQGAFHDYAVQCDARTTTAEDIDRGVVNLLVQFAPTSPTEFIVLQVQQLAAAPPA